MTCMPRQNGEGITKIAVKGFKSIVEECEIDICPLTILAGANSSGKSSIMQPLLMLKQTLEAPFDPGPLLIAGPNVQFSEAEQFLSKLSNETQTDLFLVQVETSLSDMYITVGTKFGIRNNGIEIVEMSRKTNFEIDQSSFPQNFTLSPDMTPKEIKSLFNQDSPDNGYNVVKRSRCFLYICSLDSNKFYEATSGLGEYIYNTIHLLGLRGNPKRTYKLSSTGPQYHGTFEHYAASIIHQWQETRDKRLTTLLDTLYILELTGRVRTKKIGDVGVEVQVSRLPFRNTSEEDMVNIADVGIGVSQVLPVLVALTAAEPGQLVYIEQPELHLHPNAQVKLAQVLADAAKRGVRIVAETHSSLLLLGIQTLVAEGKLPPELVKLHWFSRNKNGITEVDSVDLDEAGTYGEWPVDFDDISLKLKSRFLNAVDSVRFSKKENS